MICVRRSKIRRRYVSQKLKNFRSYLTHFIFTQCTAVYSYIKSANLVNWESNIWDIHLQIVFFGPLLFDTNCDLDLRSGHYCTLALRQFRTHNFIQTKNQFILISSGCRLWSFLYLWQIFEFILAKKDFDCVLHKSPNS